MSNNSLHTKYFNKANNFVYSHKKYSSNSYINPVNLGRYYYKTISEYDLKAQKNMTIYKEMKEESKEFMKSYLLIQKNKEKLNAEIKDNKLKSPFLDLINQYSQKGYKIPDLTLKKNLFSPSMILADENKMKDYFKSNKISKKEKKEFSYVKKLDNCVHKTQQKLEKFKSNNERDVGNEQSETNNSLFDSMNETKSILKDHNSNSHLFKLSQHCGTIEDENLDLEKYNKSIESCIQSFDDDTMGMIKKYIKNEMSKKYFPNSTKSRGSKFKLNNAFINATMQNDSLIKLNKKSSDKHVVQKKKNPLTRGKSNVIAYSLFKKAQNNNVELPKKINRSKKSIIKIELPESFDQYLTTSTKENESGIPHQALPGIDANHKTSYNFDIESDPSDFFNVIRKTKRKVLSYNFENVKKMILNQSLGKNATEGKNIVNKILNLDNQIANLDKNLLKSLEESKKN